MAATKREKRPEVDAELSRHMNATLQTLEEEAQKKNDGSYFYATGAIKSLLKQMAFSNQFAPGQQAQLQRILASWDQLTRSE